MTCVSNKIKLKVKPDNELGKRDSTVRKQRRVTTPSFKGASSSKVSNIKGAVTNTSIRGKEQTKNALCVLKRLVYPKSKLEKQLE